MFIIKINFFQNFYYYDPEMVYGKIMKRIPLSLEENSPPVSPTSSRGDQIEQCKFKYQTLKGLLM